MTSKMSKRLNLIKNKIYYLHYKLFTL